MTTSTASAAVLDESLLRVNAETKAKQRTTSQSSATVSTTFTADCTGFTSSSSKDISHIVIDGVKIEPIDEPTYTDPSGGAVIGTVEVKSGQTTRSDTCTVTPDETGTTTTTTTTAPPVTTTTAPPVTTTTAPPVTTTTAPPETTTTTAPPVTTTTAPGGGGGIGPDPCIGGGIDGGPTVAYQLWRDSLHEVGGPAFEYPVTDGPVSTRLEHMARGMEDHNARWILHEVACLVDLLVDRRHASDV